MKAQAAPAPIRVAVYERVSSDEQREKETIQTQTFLIDRYLADHAELEEYQRYLDDGVSGSVPLAQRPQGRRLVEHAMAGRFGRVLVTRADRLGRDAIDLLKARALLEGLGIELVGIAESLDDYVTFGVKAVVSDHEKRRFLERSAEGMERIVRAGYFPGGIVPLGYTLDGQKPHQRLVPSDILMWQDMTESGVVRWVYDRLALDRWSCPCIARQLNAMGVPTSYAKDRRYVRGKRTEQTWRSGRIGNMVNNTVYRGEYIYGKRGGTKLISVEVPRLVSDETWQAAQETLRANRLLAKNTSRTYLLRSLIECGQCGHHYSGAWHRNGVRYRCNGAATHRLEEGERCKAKEIMGEGLEQPIRADLERFLRNPGAAVDDLLRQLEQTSVEPPEVARRLQLEGALADRQAERKRLLRVFLKGTISEEEFEAERAAIDSASRTLEEALGELEAPEAPDYVDVATTQILEQLHERLDEGLTDEEWHEVFRLLVKRITVHTTFNENGAKEVRAHVIYRFPGFVPTSTGTGSWPPRTGATWLTRPGSGGACTTLFLLAPPELSRPLPAWPRRATPWPPSPRAAWPGRPPSGPDLPAAASGRRHRARGRGARPEPCSRASWRSRPCVPSTAARRPWPCPCPAPSRLRWPPSPHLRSTCP